MDKDLSKYYTDFGVSKPKNKSILDQQQIHNLYKIPKKDKGVNMPHFQVLSPGVVQQADLLFLPYDDGYKYTLVVVDVNNRITDTEPLKTKDSETVLKAFKKIYERATLKIPQKLLVDDGAEFKGAVKKYFKEQGVKIRVAQSGRHRQQGIVERKNQQIQVPLFKRMTAQEILTGHKSKEWVDDISIVVDALNKNSKKNMPPKIPDKPVCEGDSCTLLEQGSKVRVALDNPKDYASDKKLHGKFRSSDIRWDPEIRTIKEIIIKPGFPPMYMLDGKMGERNLSPVAYTKNQLQVVPKNEQVPLPKVIRGKHEEYVVKELVDKKKIDGKVHYQVHWLGFDDKKDYTWQKRSELIESVPTMVKLYEENNK